MRILSMLAVGVLLVGSQAGAQATMPRDLPDGRGRVIPGDQHVKRFDRVPIEPVWKAVEVAYRQAGIRPSSVDAGNYRITYVAAPAGGKIGNMKIENAFDCGGDKKAPLAATTEMSVSVSTLVRPMGEGAESVTSVVATPVPPADGSPAIVCRSKGTLERKLEPQLKFEVRVVSKQVRPPL
jgi:hypothetical protein